jgi:hypothetical protein
VLLRDYVQIRQGTPYTVPQNKILMITAFGSEGSSYAGNLEIRVDGITRLLATPFSLQSSPFALSVLEVPRGLTVGAGSIVEVFGTNGVNPAYTVAWGFLADA